jgi:hypothetical protein
MFRRGLVLSTMFLVACSTFVDWGSLAGAPAEETPVTETPDASQTPAPDAAAPLVIDASVCEGGPCPSCNVLKQNDATLPNGTYTIDPDGTGPLAPMNVFCDMTFEGGGWTFVRRNPPGDRWTNPDDNLAGVVSVGAYEPNPQSPNAFSAAFASIPFWDFLFRTGDDVKWLIAPRSEVYEGWSDVKPQPTPCNILKSNTSTTSYVASWFKRKSNIEDPWIGTEDHESSRESANHSMLYGEAVAQWTLYVRTHNGANVFVR